MVVSVPFAIDLMRPRNTVEVKSCKMIATTEKEGNVLFVDDSLTLVDNNLFNQITEMCHVKACSSLDSALDVSAVLSPDVIICNIDVTPGAAFEFSRRLRIAYATVGTFVYFITDNIHTDRWRNCFMLGGVDLLSRVDSAVMLKNRVITLLRYQNYLLATANSAQNSKHIGAAHVAPIDRDRRFVDKAQNIVQKNLSNTEFTITCLANAMGVSHNMFYRKIKQLTGKTASQFIRQQRLLLAGRLIKETHHPIFYIMMKTGFSSGAYFSRCFRDSFGCSPSTYRKTA